MVTRLARPRLLCLMIGVAVLAACAPAPAPGSPVGGASTEPSAGAAAKTLRMGMLAGSEPTSGIVLNGQSGTGPPEHGFMLHAGLTNYDGQGNLQPWIATTVPSVERGDWKLLADGQMEVTWNLRPGVRWHDGAALTAGDFAFGLQLLQDPEMTTARSRVLSLITGADAPDGETLVVRWKQPYILANAAGLFDLPAVPRHLVADLYARDKQAALNSPYWTTQFIGIGPYRLARWESGSQMEVVASDDYFLGRPKVDRIVVDYFGDVNGVVAGLLSGDIDVAPVGALKTTELVTLRSSWEANGAGTTLPGISGTRNYRFQYRDPSAPWARDLRVRQALIHMLDRQAIVDSLLHGLTTPADTVLSPDDPAYKLLEQRGLTRYPYDLARAQAMMAEAGWRRGADGSYRNAAGEPFTIDVSTSAKTDNVVEGQAVAAQWKDAGLNTTFTVIPDRATNRDEMRATFPGVLGWPMQRTPQIGEYFISAQIPTERTRWSGSNSGGYTNPAYDALYDQYLVTLELPRRQEILADLLKIQADEAVAINLYYDFSTYIAAYRKGVRGPLTVTDNQPVTSWNVATWEMN